MRHSHDPTMLNTTFFMISAAPSPAIRDGTTKIDLIISFSANIAAA